MESSEHPGVEGEAGREPEPSPEPDVEPDVEPARAGGPSASAAIRTGKEDLLGARLLSLDVYRGSIMVLLSFTGFGLAAVAAKQLEAAPESSFWRLVQYEFEHTQWIGCTIWDMIQPSFMFMVGVSMAYSYTRRKRLGQGWFRMFAHALWRSVVLVLLGVFLTSNWSRTTDWSFMNVLSQIGLGYAFLFLLWGRSPRTQGVAAVAVLVGTWLLYVLWPQTGLDVSAGAPAVGVSADWARENLAGVSGAWHKCAGAGHAIDLWFLGLFPREEAFAFNRGGYQTINFVPSLATMIFGLMSGELLRSGRPGGRKLKILFLAGLGGLVAGELLGWTGLCPIVKRIWTPSWALFSSGWCCLILAALYGVIDVLGQRWWTFPLVIVGMNSIAMYCMGMLLKGWTAGTLKTHFGHDLFELWGPLHEPFLHYTLVGLAFWLVCWWLYRHRIFLRI